MRALLGRLSSFMRELRRRRVYGVAAVSAAIAWAVIEVASVVLPTFHAPHWLLQVVVVVAILGVVTAVLLAWIYKLGPEGIERDVARSEPLVSPASGADPARRSLVVLPFMDLAADDQNRYVSDGLTELLIARLAGISSLSVISRTTAMQYRDTDKKIPQIAGELNVTHLIEGSILRSGEQLQVVVQLIDGRTDRHLWAEDYNRALTDVMSLLNEIAATVAERIRVEITPDEEARLSRSQAVPPAAMDAYLRGSHHLSRRSAGAFQKALAAFQEAIDLAPGFAAAYAHIADIHVMSAIYGFRSPADCFPVARANAEKAVEYDHSSAEGHTSRASIKMFYDWDFAGAERDYERALESNPSYARAHLAYGDLLWVYERGEDALEHIRQAVRLDPLDLGMNMNLGDFLYFAGRFDDCAKQHRKVLDMNPDFFPSMGRLARALACAGDEDGALAALERLQARAPRPVWLEAAALTLAMLGREGRARDALAALREESADYLSPLPQAWACAALGDHDDAIEWLARSLEERSPAVIFSHLQPAFGSLKGDSRFEDLLTRIGIPASRTDTAR